jgi:hypothetical protein
LVLCYQSSMMSDDQLCAAFDLATLPKEHFHHREHLRVAFLYLARHGEAAGPRFCAALSRFATAHGAPGKYRKDLTLDWLARIGQRAAKARYADSEEFLERNPELLDG